MDTYFSIEVEKELIGSMLRDNSIVPDVAENVAVEDFYLVKHKLIYSKILALYKNSKDINPVTLYEAMQGANESLSEVLQYGDIVASTSAYRSYIDIIKDYKKKRDIAEFCNKALSQLASTPSVKVATELTEQLFDLNKEKSQQTVVDSMGLMLNTIQYAEEAYKTKGASVGMKTGWGKFDYSTNGFAKGDLIILGGRPSMGKTAFALEIIQRLAGKGHGCALFELEMPLHKLGIRILSSNTGVNAQKIYKGLIEEDEFMVLMHESDRIAKQDKIFTDTTPDATLLHIRNKVRQLKLQKDIDVVIVDHIGYMTPSDPKKNTNVQISEISKGLKAIAKEYDVAVIALSQLSRDVERRNDKRPLLSDLRDSGSLEQDADMVFLIYRDSYYNPEAPVRNGVHEVEINVAKSRDGKVGILRFDFNMDTQRFKERISTEERVGRVGGKR